MNGIGAPDCQLRSVDEWKASLLTLQDNAYFDLLRSVFGNIKTPFNKHHLMENLTAFLTRREIQDTISAYINEADHRIIAAIVLLNEPVAGDLENFFTGEYSGAELHSMLLNLEERLLVYRFRDEGVYRITLNPLLEPVLAPFIADKSVLFPSFYADGQTDGQPLPRAPDPAASKARQCSLDDRTFAAFIAFVAAQREFFKTGGGIRKKVIDDGKQIFPELDIEVLIEGLRCTGLIGVEGTRLVPEQRKLAFFGKLSFRERLEYLAAGIYAVSQNSETDSVYFRRSRVQNLARFIHRFTGILEYGRLYPQQTLLRFVGVLERTGGDTIAWGESGFASLNLAAPEVERLLAAMETMGLLRAAGETNAGIAYMAEALPREASEDEAAPERPMIAMDSPFSCILYPEIGFCDAVTLASFCDCRETGTTVRFELTRDSAVRGFDLGLRAEDMIGILERLSLGTLDQNLCWTINDWDNRYSAVSLFQGTVLTLAEDRRYLAEKGILSSLIHRILAPGVYLLAVPGKDEVVQTLQKAGVDIIAQPPLAFSEDGEDRDTVTIRSPYPSTAGFSRGRQPAIPAAAVAATAAIPADHEKAAEARKEKFREALRKSRLPKPDQDELAARIERRLIVSESQLAGGAVRREKIEARNLDYVGKVVVAKQAIAGKSLVEILLPSLDGGENRILGIPQALEKSGGETILVIQPAVRYSGAGGRKPEEEIKIPLGKISLLRWIKQSIFTG
jgi:hypothetical protein